MSTSTFLLIRRNRYLKIIRGILLTVLLVSFVNFTVSAQCTVTGVSGSGFLFAGQCAPVNTGIYYDYTFGPVAPANSSFRVYYFWGDGVTTNVIVSVQSKTVLTPAPVTVYYVHAEMWHTYPAAGNCEYYPYMILSDQGYQCPDSRQTQIVANWQQDDIAAANGVIRLNPTPRRDVCVGLPLVDFQFADNSRFACNLQQYPLAQKPNHTARYEQFVYGTNPVAGRGIPNLSIKVGTAQTVVQLTDVNGNTIPGPWNVDPTTGGTVPWYNTQSGYFEGPIVQIPLNATTGVYALNNSYRISFDGVGDAFQDQFQVTVRNWNVCNPWNGSTTNPNAGGGATDANIATSLIYIINGPLANAGPDDAICSGDTYTMNGSYTNGTSAKWTRTNGSTTGFSNPTSPNGAVYTPSTADKAAGYVDLVLHAYAGGSCTEETDMMRLTIDPLPAVPTISLTGGPNGFCDNNSTSLTLTSTVSPSGNYLWNPSGLTTRAITLNDYTQSDDYTVTVYGTTPRACPATSLPFTVTIGQPATVNAGVNQTVCSNSTVSLNGSRGGSATSSTWTSSGSGSFGNVSQPVTTYTLSAADIAAGSVTLTLTTNDPVGMCPAVSDNMVVTIIAAPAIYAGADVAICQGSTYTVNDATAANYNTIAWTENGVGSITSGSNTLTPKYTPAAADYGNTITLTLTATGNAPCANVIDTKLLYVDRTPVATVGPAQNICGPVGAIATLSGNNGGNDLLSGAAGNWHFTDKWFEDFTGLNGFAIDIGATPWTRTTSLTGPGWLSQVVSEQFKVTNNNTVWTSGNINISGQANVGITIDFSSYSTGNGFEPADIIQASYILDGVSTTFYSALGAVDGSTGAFSRPLLNYQASASSINGNNLVIQITLYTDENDEIYQFDNVRVRKSGSTVINDPSNPTSTVTNLSQGSNFFTWTVSSAHKGCPDANANLTITRDLSPAAANAGTDQAFCETTSATMAANTATNGGTGTWTLQSGSGSITSANSPTTTVTGLGYGPNVFRWRITSALGICAATQSDVTITRNQNPADKTIAPAKNPVCYNSSTNINVPLSQSGVRYDLYKTVGSVFVGSVNGNGGTVSVSTGLLIANTSFYMVAVNTTTSCTRTLNTVTVNVNPQFSLAQLHDDIGICVGTAANFNVVLTGGVSPYTINYTQGGVAQPVLNNYVSGTSISTGNLAATAAIVITSATDATGCPAESFGSAITISVGTVPTNATFTGNGPLCYNGTGTLTSVITGGSPPYTLTIAGYSGSPFVSATTNASIPLGVQAPGTYNYTLTSVVDNCGKSLASGLPKNYSLVVYGDLTPGTIGNSQAICYNTAPIGLTELSIPTGGTGSYTYQWQSSPNNSTWSDITTGGTSATYSPGALTTNTYYRRNVTSGTCGTVNSTSVLISINPLPTITTAASTANVCFSTALQTTTLTYSATTNSPTTYSITWNAAPANTFVAVTDAAMPAASPITISVPANTAAGTYTGTITVKNGNGCVSTGTTFTVKVNPLPTITATSTADVCFSTGAQTTTLAYTTTNSPTTYSITWNAAPANSFAAVTNAALPAASPITISVPANTAAGTYTGTITVKNGNSCVSTGTNFTVTVNPLPTITATSAAGVCFSTGAQTTTLAYTTTNSPTTYSITWNAVPANSFAAVTNAAMPASSPITISVPANTATGTYTGTITVKNGNSCVSTGTTFTVKVNPLPTITATSTADVCFSTSAQTTTLAYTTTYSPTTYSITWNAAPANSFVAVTDAAMPAASPITISVPANTAAGTYTGTITVKNGNSCVSTGTTFTVKVNPLPTITATSTADVCFSTLAQNTTLAYNVTNSPTTYSITWNAAPANSFAAVSNAAMPAASPITISVPANTSAGTYTGTITVKNGNSCVSTGINFTVTVNPLPTITATSTADVCFNTSAQTTTLAYTTTNSPTTYSITWNAAPVNSFATVTNAAMPAASPITIAVPANTAAGTYTGTITVKNGNGCVSTGTTFTVKVNPLPTITATSTADVCFSTGAQTTTLAYTTTNSPTTYSITWNATPANSFAAVTNAALPAASPITISVPANTAAGTYTGTITVKNGNSCVSTGTIFGLKVNPLPTINTTGTAGTVCSNTAAQLTTMAYTATTNNPVSYSIDWSPSANGAGLSDQGNTSFIFSAGGGVINNINIPGGTAAGVYTGIMTILNANGCSNTQNVSVTIVFTPDTPAPTGTTSVCGNGTTTYLYRIGNGSYTLAPGNELTWTVTGPAPLPVVEAAGGTTDKYIILSFPGTGTFTLTVQEKTTAPIVCVGLAKSLSITVNPVTGPTSFSAGPTTVCQDAPNGTYTASALNSTSIIYSSFPSGAGVINPGTGEMDWDPAFSGLAIITATASGLCGTTSNDVFVTITPTVTVTAYSPATSVRCQGSGTITYATTATNNSSAIVYSLDAASLAGSNTINSTTGTVTYAAGWSGVTTITATAAGCVGGVSGTVSRTHTVTITPTVTLAAFSPATSVRCQGAGTVTYSTTATNNSSAIVYSLDPTSLAGGNTINAASGAVTYASGWSGTTTITATAAGCTGGVTGTVTRTHIVTVNPLGQVNDPLDQVICHGSSVAAVNFTTNNTGGITTYTWVNDKPSIGLAASGTGNIASFIGSNTTTSPVTATIQVTPHYNNGLPVCDGPSQTFTITVNPAAQVNIPANQVVCNGSSTSTVNFATSNTGGTTNYTWTNDETSIGLVASGSGDIPFFTAINTGTSPVTATISVTPHFTNGSVTCNGSAQTFTITVNPTAQVNDLSNQIVCNGMPVFAVNFTTANTVGTTTYTWTNNETSIGLGASGSTDIASFNAINTGTAPVVATIVVTPHFANGSVTCNGPSKSFTITVNPTAQVNDPADQVVCNGAPVTAINFGTLNTGGSTTYTWTNSASGIGLGASGSGNIASFAAVNTGTVPVVATITVTPHFTNGTLTCNGTAQTFTITVNPTGQMTDPADQTVCNNTATAPVTFTTLNTIGTTTYTWTNSASGIGLAASGLGNIPSFTAVNTGTSPVVATIVVTSHFSYGSLTCDGPAQTFTITVNPTGQINDPADQLVCNGAPVSTVIFTTNNTGGSTTYSWTNSATSIGLPATGSGNIASFTATNTGTAPVVATIIVTPTFTNNFISCAGSPETFTITVNPSAQVNDLTNQLMCNGSPTLPVTFSTANTGGTTTYSWTNSAPGIGLAASGAGDIPAFNTVNTGTSPVVATIAVTPHFTNGSVTCNGPVKSFTITVNPDGQVNDPGDQVVCNGSPAAAINFTTNRSGGITTYTWTNSAPGIGLPASGSGNIASFPATNTGTSPVIATVTVTPHFNNGLPLCDGTPQTFTITVNPTAQVNVPANQVVCNGSSTSTVNFGTTITGGTTNYTWTNDETSIGLGASGSGDIPFFTAINTGTSPVTATITVTPHFTNSSVTCNGSPQSFTITVNPTAQVNDLSNQIVCNGMPVSAVNFTTANTVGTTTYTWTNSETSIGLGASGSTDITSFNAINTGTSPVVATIIVTPHFANGSVTCNGPSKSFTFTVNPTAQVNDPADQVVCNGAPVTAINFGTVNTGGGTTYTWTNDNSTIGLGAGGSGNIASFAAVNTGTVPVVATITVTPHFKNATVTCDGPAQSFTITINPTAQVNDPADQVVCNGSATAAVTFNTANTVGTTTYSWTNNAPGINLAASGTGNIPSFTASNITTAPVVATITVTPHYTYGSVTCDGPVQTFSITVNPTGQVNDPVDQVRCNGSSVAAVNFTTNNTGGITTYTWVNDSPSIGLAASGTGSIASFVATNTTTSPVVATIQVTPHFNNGLPVCDGAAQTFTITVNPTGQVIDPADQVVCNGSSVAMVIFGTNNLVGTTTYTWTNDQISIGLAASGSGNIAAFAATNPGTSPVVATITVTPHFTNGSVTCNGPAETFSITVNPTAQVNDPVNQVVCNGLPVTAVHFTTNNSGGSTTYTWVNSTSGIGLGSTGSGDIPSFLAINTGTSPEIANIVVTPHFTNGSVTCDGPSQSFTITVNPTGQVNDPANQVVCNGSMTASVIFGTNNTGGTTTYSWSNNNTSIGLGATGTGNIAAFAAANTGVSPVVATITVTPHFTNGLTTCNGLPESFIITVNPTAQVNDPSDQVVCNGLPTAAVNFSTNNTGGTYTYNWTNNATAIGLAASGSGNIGSFNAVNNGTSPVVATITVTPYFENGLVSCNGPSQTFTITVNPTGQVNTPANQVACNGSLTLPVNFTSGNTGGTTTYSWVNDNASIGLGAGASGNIAVFTATNITMAPVTANITVTPHYANGSVTCDGTPKTFTITVNPSGNVADPPDQSLCNGSTTAAVVFTSLNTGGTTTFSWTNNATSINLPAAGTGDILPFVTSNITSAPVVATITVTPHFTNGTVTCNGPVQSFTITVYPTGQVNDPADQTVCAGSMTLPVVFATTNTGGTTTYDWVNDNTAIGLPAIGSGDIASFPAANPGNTPISGSITVTPHFTNGATTCDGPTQTFTITVNPQGQVTAPSNQVVCSGSSTSTVIFATPNTGGSTTYTWTNDMTSIGLAANGSGSIPFFTASNTATVPVTANIEVTPHFTNNSVTCDGPVQTFSITVNPKGQVNDLTDLVACNGLPVPAVNFTTNNSGGTTTYTWVNSASGIGLGATGSGNIPSFLAINTGTSPEIATITVTPHFNNGSVTCDGASKTFTITVNPTGEVNDPADRVVCNGSSVPAINFSTLNTGGTTTYSWTNTASGIGLGATGSGNIPSFLAINTGNAPVTATITVTPHYTNSLVTCDGLPQTFTITVNPTAQVNDPTDQVVCDGSPTAAVTFTSLRTGGTTTYSWTNNATSIGLAANGTGDIPQFTAANAGLAPVVATITVTPHFDNGSVTCNGPVQTFTITVNPKAHVNDPLNQIVCRNTPASVTFTTANSGGLTTYTWVNDNTSIGLGASGTNNIASFTALNPGTAPVVATITVTPHFTNGLITCDGPDQSFTITVSPAGQVNDPADQVVCNGAYTSPVVFTTGNTGGTTSYTWTNDLTGIGLAASGSGNISAFAAINTGSTPVTATITVIPQFTNGLVTCNGPSETFTITVNPTGQINDPSDQVVCNGSPVPSVTFTTNNSGGTTTYTWVNDNPGIGLAANGTGNTPGFNAINTGTSPVVATVTITPHFANGSVTCNGPVQTFTITVNPTGQINDPVDRVVCNGSPMPAIAFTTNNTGGTTTYSWTNSASGIGLAASGSGNIAAFTALNTGTTPVVATITVTPHFENGSVTCDGPVETFTITVNPTPNVTTASPLTICSASSTNIALVSNVTGTTFSWTIGAVTGGITGASSSSGSTIEQILMNPGTSAGTVTYRVTPTANSCPGIPVNIVVTVNPIPNVTYVGPTTICSSATTNIALSSNVSGTSFTWTIGAVTGSISGAIPSGGSLIAQSLTNSGTTAGTITYIVTPTANGCPGIPLNILVTVNPTPDVTATGPTTICSATATNIALTSNVSGATFSWTVGTITGGVSGATASNGSTIAQTLHNLGLAAGTVTYIVTPAANNCSGTPFSIVITVNPLTGPTSFTNGAIEVCQDAPDETYLATSVNNTSIAYSVSPAAAGVIDPVTGVMNWDAVFSGNATITATSTGLCNTTVGTLLVRVKGLPSITFSPVDRIVCEFGQVNYDVTADGSDLTYQWYVDANDGMGFVPVTGGIYSGQTSATLQIWTADRTMDNFKYHAEVSGCSTVVTSGDALLTVNTAPELILHPSDKSVCLGGNAVLAADATGIVVSWQWYVNKGTGFFPVIPDAYISGETTNTLTITNAQYSFNNWIFRAKATGICGAPVFTNIARLSVANSPTVTLQPANKAICENGSVSLLSNGTAYTGLQWQYSTDGGSSWNNILDDAIYNGSNTNQVSILNAPASFNGYQYRLSYIGSCITINSNAATLTVNANPVVDFSAIDPVKACGGVPVVLNGNPVGGTAPYTHRWTGDVGPLSSYTVPTPTFNSLISGDYYINYKVTDSKGCTSNDDVIVTVDSPSAEFTRDVDNGCTPLTVNFMKDMTGIASYSWNFGDGSPVETAVTNPSHTFVNAMPSAIGYYPVQLTVRSAGGCQATFTSTEVVYPTISATFTASPQIVCSGNQITFTTTPGASKYFWDFGDGVGGYFTNTPTHLYTNFTEAPVIHTVTLTTTSFYNCTDKKTLDITVMPVPVAQFTALPVSQIFNSAGNPVTFTNVTNPGTWAWLWKFGDGATSTDQNPSHTYTTLGEFEIMLKVSNTNCSDSIKHTVSVTPIPPVASFDPIPSGCSPLQIDLNNTSLNTDTPGTTYMWDFGDGGASTSKNPSYVYFTPGTFRVELMIKGPGGTSNYSQIVNAYPSPKANFQVAPQLVFVNDEKVRCFNLSQGADSYLWEFGDGDTSKIEQPFHKYMEEGVYDITLWAYLHNELNGQTITCSDKYVLSPGVTVEPAGVLRFSTVFTPNTSAEQDIDHIPTGTQVDQFFYPPIREKVVDYKLQVFNRLGVLIFESHDINKPWNGYYRSKLCPQGVYVWYVEGKYANGVPFKKVGDVTLLH